jgi:hypothetical protein
MSCNFEPAEPESLETRVNAVIQLHHLLRDAHVDNTVGLQLAKAETFAVYLDLAEETRACPHLQDDVFEALACFFKFVSTTSTDTSNLQLQTSMQKLPNLIMFAMCGDRPRAMDAFASMATVVIWPQYTYLYVECMKHGLVSLLMMRMQTRTYLPQVMHIWSQMFNLCRSDVRDVILEQDQLVVNAFLGLLHHEDRLVRKHTQLTLSKFRNVGWTEEQCECIFAALLAYQEDPEMYALLIHIQTLRSVSYFGKPHMLASMMEVIADMADRQSPATPRMFAILNVSRLGNASEFQATVLQNAAFLNLLLLWAASSSPCKCASCLYIPIASHLILASISHWRTKQRMAGAFAAKLPRPFVPAVRMTCGICDDDSNPSEEFVFLPCIHGFHSACILDWISDTLCCPVCMEDVTGTVLPCSC